MRRFAPWKLAIVSLFLLLTGGPSVIAQYDESNPGVYWRLERERQKAFSAQRKKRVRKEIIQRPTRLIRRARPRRGYTRAVPADPANTALPAEPGQTEPQTAGAQPVQPGGAPSTATPVASGQSTADSGKATAQPAATGPVMRIAVLGDNLGSQLARGLKESYAETPQVEVLRLTKDNSGLIRTDYYDWLDAVKQLLAGDQRIDVAIMMIGSNDRQAVRADGVAHAPRSPEWDKVYSARIGAIAAQFKARNIPLIWIGMPVMRFERLSIDMVAFNQMYRDAVQKNGGIYVDIWEGFIDDRNRFTLFGPDVNGEIVKLRLNDGVHFTKAGARKVAHFAEIDIKRIIDKRKAPATAIVAARTEAGEGPRTILPAPDSPAQVRLPVRPAAGPVIELTALPLATDGELAGPQNRAAVRQPPVSLSQTRPGRGDDFRWPRP